MMRLLRKLILIKLKHKNYTFNDGAKFIIISESDKVIDGDGAVIDMNGSTIRAFTVTASGVTIKNLTIKNANYDGQGGAIYFSVSATSGTVTNCNFAGNTVDYNGGAVYFSSTGNVSNCNFADNTASGDGGAVYFLNTGSVSNCNFADNKATGDYICGGAVYFNREGTVTNCNFAGNTADYGGGAVYFLGTGNLSNCNFADNSASHGGAIYSLGWFTTADTCIFKRNSGDNVNTFICPPTLNVNNFTTVYGSGEKLTFDLKTNSSIPVTNGQEINRTVTINKVNSTITLDNIVLDYGETKNVTVTTTGATGITAKIGESEVKVDGFVISIPALDAGTYTLTVTTIADNNHNNVTKNATITVNKLKTELTGNAITTTYNVNKDLVITLKDITGKALSGVKVTVDLNGAKTYTTDKNGQVKVSTKGLAPKAYTAKVTFNGDTKYDKSTKDIKVTVKKATPKLTAKKKTYKTTPKTKKYTIVLKDNTGKAIKKAKVTLKVKGKTYKATTNSKGKATFKITNLNKKGTFKATITYKGNKYYNKVSKKANIKVIVSFKTVSKGSKDKSTVKEIQQALKDHGYYLSYKGHYLKVDGKFQSCTERSVKEFQKDKGLKVTGKVDEKTAKKLGII